jgi:hypothetical protein
MPRKLGIGEHARLLANVECDLVFEDIQYNSCVAVISSMVCGVKALGLEP